MSETVKLIIEIPKDYYEILKCEVEENQTDYYPFVVIGNGIPLDEVLDKISAEIKELSTAHCIQVMDREDIPLLALDIIEKYKAESEDKAE